MNFSSQPIGLKAPSCLKDKSRKKVLIKKTLFRKKSQQKNKFIEQSISINLSTHFS